MQQPIAKGSVRVKRVTALFFVLLTAGAAPATRWSNSWTGAQSPTVTATVVDEGTLSPLSNAEIIDLATGAHRFTDERGVARLPWPQSGELRLRARQVGFRFADRTLKRASDGSADTTTFVLSRVVFSVPPVLSTSECSVDADAESKLLAIAVLEQLREGAERYEAFRKAFPFRVSVERRTAPINPDGTARQVIRSEGNVESDRWGEPYRAGHLVDQTSSGGFSVPILFISNLADSAFWDHHCFSVKDVELFQGARVVRLDFSPAPNVHSADWAGSALVDSASSVLKRVEFRLVKLDHGDEPRRLEGYTIFRSPTPYVVVPDTTVAMWWRHDPDDGKWGNPDIVQQLQTKELRYRKDTPPAGRVP
jgi:hypothetical protein